MCLGLVVIIIFSFTRKCSSRRRSECDELCWEIHIWVQQPSQTVKHLSMVCSIYIGKDEEGTLRDKEKKDMRKDEKKKKWNKERNIRNWAWPSMANAWLGITRTNKHTHAHVYAGVTHTGFWISLKDKMTFAFLLREFDGQYHLHGRWPEQPINNVPQNASFCGGPTRFPGQRGQSP